MANTIIANSAIQGAQMGSTFGPAGTAIGAAIGIFAGYNKEKKAKKQVQKYNDAVLQNATSEMFNLQRQQNAVNQQTARSLAAYDDNAKVQSATYNASYGAADMIGSSGAAALKQVLDYQTLQAKSATWDNWEISLDSYNKQVADVYTQAYNSMLNDIPDNSSADSMAQGLASIATSLKSSSAKTTPSVTSTGRGYSFGSLSNVFSGGASAGSYSFGSLSDVYSGAGSMGATSYSYGSLGSIFTG